MKSSTEWRNLSETTANGIEGIMSTDIKEIVQEKYGETARRVAAGESSTSCCGSSTTCCGGPDPITSDLYDQAHSGDLPEKAVLASLGCGNPTALAELKPARRDRA
jgi:hypothetical protein